MLEGVSALYLKISLAMNANKAARFFSFFFSSLWVVSSVADNLKFSHSTPGSNHNIYLTSEVSLPWVGFGTCGLGGITRNLTCTALQSGVQLLDSAEAREWYWESEVGLALRDDNCQAGDNVVVVTKVHPRSYEIGAMRSSLMKSQLDLYGFPRKLDVVLLHAPFCWAGHCNEEQTRFMNQHGWEAAWRNLETMHDENLVSAIGVSNFDANQLLRLLSFANKRVAVVQNFMDPFHQDQDVLNICKQRKIAYMAYSSLGNQWRRGNPVFSNALLLEIAAEHNSTVSSVVLSWVLSSGAVVIPKSSKKNHVKMNANILSSEKINLTQENIDSIRTLDGSIGMPWE